MSLSVQGHGDLMTIVCASLILLLLGWAASINLLILVLIRGYHLRLKLPETLRHSICWRLPHLILGDRLLRLKHGCLLHLRHRWNWWVSPGYFDCLATIWCLIIRRCATGGHQLHLKTVNKLGQLLNIIILGGLLFLNRRLTLATLVHWTPIGWIHSSVITLWISLGAHLNWCVLNSTRDQLSSNLLIGN